MYASLFYCVVFFVFKIQNVVWQDKYSNTIWQLVKTSYDSGILFAAEKGKETERSTGNSSLFSSFATWRRLISTLPPRDVSLAVQTEANNYFHALPRVCIHVRGTMACIAIPPTALWLPIITQFDVCRNNAASRDSVTRELGRGAKRSAWKKKGQSPKGFSQIVISSTRFAHLCRIRVLYCYL